MSATNGAAAGMAGGNRAGMPQGEREREAHTTPAELRARVDHLQAMRATLRRHGLDGTPLYVRVDRAVERATDAYLMATGQLDALAARLAERAAIERAAQASAAAPHDPAVPQFPPAPPGREQYNRVELIQARAHALSLAGQSATPAYAQLRRRLDRAIDAYLAASGQRAELAIREAARAAGTLPLPPYVGDPLAASRGERPA